MKDEKEAEKHEFSVFIEWICFCELFVFTYR